MHLRWAGQSASVPTPLTPSPRHPWPTQWLHLSRQQHQKPVLLPTGWLSVELWAAAPPSVAPGPWSWAVTAHLPRTVSPIRPTHTPAHRAAHPLLLSTHSRARTVGSLLPKLWQRSLLKNADKPREFTATHRLSKLAPGSKETPKASPPRHGLPPACARGQLPLTPGLLPTCRPDLVKAF